MIIGSGVDIVSSERFAKVSDDDDFISQILTEREKSYVGKNRDRLALSFALKEAVFKSLGCGLSYGSYWRDVEISAGGEVTLLNQLRDEAGKIGVSRIHSSYSCSKQYITAFVLLER